MRNPHVQLKSLLFAVAVMALSAATVLPTAAASQRPTDEDERHYAERGVEMMMDGVQAAEREVQQQQSVERKGRKASFENALTRQPVSGI